MATTDKRVALVTGANKGIGLEIARKLGKRGFTVLVGARDAARGDQAAEALRRQDIDARAVQLDVTDPATITATSRFIGETYDKLDVLVNNAGVLLDHGVPASEASLDHIRKVFDTNFFGVIAVTQALLPLLRRSPAGRIVNLSSGLGSLTQMSDPQSPFRDFQVLGYNASKTALNAFTVALAYELRDTPIKVNSADPGWVKTDMGGAQAPGTAEEGADTPAWLATLPADGPTGGFFSSRQPLAW